jgi:hypothetical protein
MLDPLRDTVLAAPDRTGRNFAPRQSLMSPSSAEWTLATALEQGRNRVLTTPRVPSGSVRIFRAGRKFFPCHSPTWTLARFEEVRQHA